ncbi:MAG: DUF2254 domain-containing protein [Gammaproteobacteria bacterium]
MKARFQKLLGAIHETFWLLPGLMVCSGVLAAFGLIAVDRGGWLPKTLLEGPWLYNGGGTGARTLLGAVASSTIGVAGTVFSITIAALSLAAGQMGPRLLRNFVRDRGNQFTLGTFLATFAYALMVLRSVRSQSEGEFVPHLSLTVAIVLAMICVATLVFFVGHMAGRINVDVVIELVSDDVRSAIKRLTSDERTPAPPPAAFWRSATVVTDSRRGYLQQLDEKGLANWAQQHETHVRMLIRPGNYVFPGAPIALIVPPAQGAEGAIREATALGAQRASSADLEFAVRHLVEVAVRALSPGINDPHTAMGVLDRLGSALCDIVPVHLHSGLTECAGEARLVVPAVDYDGLTDVMFHLIRQNAAGSPTVLIYILKVLMAVVSCEHDSKRVASLRRHAALVMSDGERGIKTPADLHDLRQNHARFEDMSTGGPIRVLLAEGGPS